MTRLGLNLRLSEINAAIGKIQMKKLPSFLIQRRKNAKILTELLQNCDVVQPKQRKHETLNWYLYTIAHKNRNKVMRKLNSLGIGATAYYSTPIHKTPYFKTKKKLPNTEWASSHILCLPIHPKVGTSDLEKMQRVLGNKK